MLAGPAVSVGLDAVGFVSLAWAWAWVCWIALFAVCVLPPVTAEADASLSPPLSAVAGADAWFAGAVSSYPAPAQRLARPSSPWRASSVVWLPSPIAAVAALAVLTGVGGLTGGATVIAAATGCVD